jgi:predicted Zn-dependent protease
METINVMEYSQYKDCYVKIVCVNKSNPYALDMMLDKLYKESPADISIVEDVSTFTENGVDEINEAEDTQTILDKFVDNLTLPVSNDRMKSYLKDIYQEALTVEHI